MVKLSDAPLYVSKISCECKVWHSRRNHRNGGLVTFRGIYPSGSAGKDDARYIRWALSEFYVQYQPDGLVIDCRNLKYEWGDDLDFQASKPRKTDHFPLLIVLLPEQHEAYEFAIQREVHRVDLQTALEEMNEAIRAMKSLL